MTRIMLAAAVGLLAVLVVGTCHGQTHDHNAPAKIVGKKKDPQRGMVMAAPRAGETVEHSMDHALPVGDGAPASTRDGAWFNAPVTGVYTFPQLSLVPGKDGKRLPVFMAQATPGPVELIAGRPYRLWPWKGPLVYIPPQGTQQKVPPELLLPVNPSTVAPPKK